MIAHSVHSRGLLWVVEGLAGANPSLSVSQSRASGSAGDWNGADQRQTQEVPVRCAQRPSLYLFFSLEIMPRLPALLVEESPSLDVCSLIFATGCCLRAILVLLLAGTTISLMLDDHYSPIGLAKVALCRWIPHIRNLRSSVHLLF